MSHESKYPLDASQVIIDQTARPTEYFENYLYENTLTADAVAGVASADATDLATAITLANELKARVNELLTNLRESGKLSD